MSSVNYIQDTDADGTNFIPSSQKPDGTWCKPITVNDGHVQILEVAGGAVVCVEAEVLGDVKIGAKTVVHPCAKILATNGPIIIGDGCIVEELATVENISSEPLLIGNNNVFEVGCVVHARDIGDNNLFETRCIVGEGVKVGFGCTFGAGTTITSPITVPDNSVFFGEPLRHRIATEKTPTQSLQIDFLSRVLPNYHHLKKSSPLEKTPDPVK